MLNVPIPDEYFRYAKVDSIVDGDTVIAIVDLGFSVFSKLELRLLDVFAFETKGTEKELGLKDKNILAELIPVGSSITIQTIKTKSGKDKKSFTRYIAKIWTKDGLLINDLLKKNPQGGIGVK